MTTTPAVLDALERLLPDAVEPEVHRGFPGESSDDTLVIIGNVEGDQQPAALGSGPSRRREESYVVHVIVQMYDEVADTQSEVTEAAFAVFADIETLLRDNPSLDGACRIAQVEGLNAQESPATYGYMTLIEVKVRVHARV